MSVEHLDKKKSSRKLSIKSVVQDGWRNILAGLGTSQDKTEHTHYGYYQYLDDQELSELYMGDGLAKRIIDLLPEDAVRPWVTIQGDDNNVIQDELRRLGLKEELRKALSWTRLYRGALIVLIEEGAKELANPLPANVRGISKIRTYPASRIDIIPEDIRTDPTSTYFEDIEYFPVRLRNGNIMRVHHSRCLVFKGEQAPDDQYTDFEYRYWGMSTMIKIYDRLKNLSASEKGIANGLLEYSYGKIKIANLVDILSMNDREAVRMIQNRIDVIQASKSQINAVLIGEGEEYSSESTNFAGVNELFEKLMLLLTATAEYPFTRLYGRSPAGMNATGESDNRQYYDKVANEQETKLLPAIDKIVMMIAQYTNTTYTDIMFNSLWQTTEKEQAEVEMLHAQIDQIYMNGGVLSPEEVTLKRFPEIAEDPDRDMDFLYGSQDDPEKDMDEEEDEESEEED